MWSSSLQEWKITSGKKEIKNNQTKMKNSSLQEETQTPRMKKKPTKYIPPLAKKKIKLQERFP